MATQVLPQCTPGGEGPRSIIVMDNARIHQSIELDQLCGAAGVLLVKLPPYSPDFNPIETSFSVLKQWMKRNTELIQYYTEERGGFGEFICAAIRAQNEDQRGDPGALFRASGIDYNP